MPLNDYWSKRDFTKTPEPHGTVERHRAKKPLFFCVQKHLASHLHYDFRLEHDGVLLSWAVPKGPSLDPRDRRLAMHVEDHPLDYGTFEGVIPSGYGAGIVMLWDQGTWRPEVDDVDAALRKGDLKFQLEGFKLKGSWVLVRTRGGESRSWLLIKHRDEWAGPVDITTFAPLSVKTNGDFADILAEEQPAIWESHRPARGGEAGAMFEKIIARALQLKRELEAGEGGVRPPRPRAPRSRKAARTAAKAPSRPVRRGASRPGARTSTARTRASTSGKSVRKRGR